MTKQSSLFYSPEQEKLRNLRAKRCVFFSIQQKAQRAVKAIVHDFLNCKN